jgi:hypothetical protein
MGSAREKVASIQRWARTGTGRSSSLPPGAPPGSEADLHGALQKIIEYIKIEEGRLQRCCDGATVAREIADLEVVSSSLAHSSRYFSPFFLPLGTAVLSMN